jgi:hypothetical protein
MVSPRSVLRGTAFLAMAGLAACGGSRNPAPARSGNVIAQNELESVEASNAYDAVARLRPLWLSRRSGSSSLQPTPLLVYVDHRPVGGIDALRDIPTVQVKTLRYVPPVDARLTYNTQADNGIIEVTLR